MRIGILTFHKSINNGAVMQSYSLSKRLQKEFPEDTVEIIDYHMPKIEKSYSSSLRVYFNNCSPVLFAKKLVLLILNPLTLVRKKKQKKIFESVANKLPLSQKTIFSDETHELFDYINNNYDIVIAGSDAIWNYTSRGFPNPYFLDCSVEKIKMSYAASCYGLNYERVPEKHKQKIKEILDDYSFLGVRDDESAKFVTEMGCNKETFHTCDPTVFLDVDDLPIDEEALKNKLKRKGFDFEKETIGIMGTSKMFKMVRKMYRKKYQLVSLYNYRKYADVNLDDLSPYEWAYVFRLFRLTFTTYFHGTLVSLRNSTPVVCIALETEYSKVHQTKVADFLNRVSLSDCYFHTDYKNQNITAIKEKADFLLNNNIRNEILKKMDTEAQSADMFFEKIRNIKN